MIGGDDAPIGPDVDVAIWLANKLLTVKVSEMYESLMRANPPVGRQR
jgi:hypothetical protein